MYPKTISQTAFAIVLLSCLLLAACSPSASPAAATAAAPTAATSTPPDWFKIKLTDVQTGQTFTMNDFAGKVVLVETMAEWCPTCRAQQNEVKKLRALLSNPQDLVSVSLDEDLHEDAASLKEYVNAWGYDWRFAVAPLEVDRALGNLYSAEFLNPPLAPMLVIDRQGNVFSLPFGVKSAEALQKTLETYLAP